MQINKTVTENGIEFEITGSLSGVHNSTNQLFEAIEIALGDSPEEIRLNLANTTFIDSIAIGLLIGILLKCKEKDVPFRITNLPPHLVSLFDSTNIKKIFPNLY